MMVMNFIMKLCIIIEMARDLCNQYKSYVKGNPKALEWAYYVAEQLSSLASGSIPMGRR